MMDSIKLFSEMIVQYFIWILIGLALIIFSFSRKSSKDDGDIAHAIEIMESMLAEAPDRLYESVHPNWGVYRNQIMRRLKSSVPDIPDYVATAVLSEFESRYKLSEGVYIRIKSTAEETQDLDGGVTPLIAPVEGFRLNRVELRRKRRKLRSIIAGIIGYIVIVALVFWVLVFLKK